MRISDWSSDVCSSDLNVLYHFESAAGLQSALMASMIDDLVTALGDAVAQIKSDDGAPFTIVNRVLDAFDGGGAGPLAAWIVLSRGFSHLAPVRDAVQALVIAFRDKFADEDADERVRPAVMPVAIYYRKGVGEGKLVAVRLGVGVDR